MEFKEQLGLIDNTIKKYEKEIEDYKFLITLLKAQRKVEEIKFMAGN